VVHLKVRVPLPRLPRLLPQKKKRKQFLAALAQMSSAAAVVLLPTSWLVANKALAQLVAWPAW
jgi:hypothetical protein